MYVSVTSKTTKPGGLSGPLVAIQVECHCSDHIPLKWFRAKVTNLIDAELYNLGLIPNSTIFYSSYSIMGREYKPIRNNSNTISLKV
jgi:hypothetical protein